MTIQAKLRSVRDMTAACHRLHSDGRDHTSRLDRLVRRKAEIKGEIASELGVSVWDLEALFK